jgi:4-hydroxymandelate oxidase
MTGQHPPPPSEAERLAGVASSMLPRPVFEFVSGGADDESALVANSDSWSRFRFHPRVLRGVGTPDLRTRILGRPLSAPILIAPMGLQRLVHHEGELATASAASQTGIGYVLAMGSSVALEEVAPVVDGWFQLYPLRNRDVMADLVRRAETAGYRAICLTVDSPVVGTRRRDRHNRFSSDVSSANFDRYPDLAGTQGFLALLDDRADWSTLDLLRDWTALPIVVKGILDPGDAAVAVRHGASAVVVSNHGGRQLGQAVAPADVLSGCVEAVAGEADVLVDGGVRTGADVAIALELGARAVLIGRPILWALCVGGSDAAVEYLDGVTAELATTMKLLGAAGVEELNGSHVVRRRTFP